MKPEKILQKAIEDFIYEYQEDGMIPSIALKRIKKLFKLYDNTKEELYTEDHLAYFAGYVAGKRMINPSLSISDILEDWKENRISHKRKES